MIFLKVNCLVEKIAWLVLFPQGCSAHPQRAPGRDMQELDLASPSPSADLPYLHGNRQWSAAYEAILTPAAGKGKLPVAEGFIWRHKAKPCQRTGKLLLSSTTLSEFVLKDFLSQASVCLITAIAKTVNS